MPIEQLGHEAAELLSLTNGGEARSLNKLAELAAWQVPHCSGAHAAVWRDMAAMGWPGLRVAEDAGGSGLGMAPVLAPSSRCHRSSTASAARRRPPTPVTR